MTKEDWDVRSNLKNKPGAQGTLFSGGASQMPDAKRYKKGYNPERSRAIDTATGGTGASARIVDRVGVGHGPVKMSNTGWTRSTKEMLKRSSVPADHLKGVFIQRMHRDDPLAGGALDGAHGVYQHLGGSTGNILIDAWAHEPTVLHEIGHHASRLSQTSHRGYSTPLQRGLEEGFADRYADEHAPPWSHDDYHADRFAHAHRRGLANYQPSHGQRHDSEGTDRTSSFEAGYTMARPMETRVPNRMDLLHADNAAYMAERHKPQPAELPGMSAQDRLSGTGAWERNKP